MAPGATGISNSNERAAGLTRRSFVRRAAATLLVGGIGARNIPWAYGAAPADTVPPWFARDIARQARWLPEAVRRLGVEGAYRERWSAFPADVRAILGQMRIPRWMVALVPMAAGRQKEILKQFRFMADLAGAAPANPVALRAEQLLIFGGAAQLPTPGDKITGACLGDEGCTAAISKYVLAQLKLEFPGELAAMSDALANSQSSDQMRHLFEEAAQVGLVRVRSVPFRHLRAADFQPGSVTIAQKPGGTHVFGWTRVPRGWDWNPGDRMAVGNTGLPQYGDHMILAQEFVTPDPKAPGEFKHNRHGPINSRSVVYVGGEPDLADPRTNVYAAEGGNFILVDLLSGGGVAAGVADRRAAR